MVENISRTHLRAELDDLVQMVYLILLEYEESKLQDLWEKEQINYFIARIILNQYRSSNSPFHAVFRRYQEHTVSLGAGGEISDEAIEYINKTFMRYEGE